MESERGPASTRRTPSLIFRTAGGVMLGVSAAGPSHLIHGNDANMIIDESPG